MNEINDKYYYTIFKKISPKQPSSGFQNLSSEPSIGLSSIVRAILSSNLLNSSVLTFSRSERFANISLIDFLVSIGLADDSDLVKGLRNNYIKIIKTNLEKIIIIRF